MHSAIPMVCFCDLPLSQIKHHVLEYGSYGIGMKKDWGILNRLNPVIYLSENSVLDAQFINMLPELEPRIDVASNTINYIYGYLKPVKGISNKNGKSKKDYMYYHEREWRYIPVDMDKKSFLTSGEYQDKKQKKDLFIKEKLDFAAYDIKYLIVKDEFDIHNMIDIINRSGISQLDATIERLTTRIITIKNIFEDI
jgi:hypothetical protein